MVRDAVTLTDPLTVPLLLKVLEVDKESKVELEEVKDGLNGNVLELDVLLLVDVETEP